MSTQTAELVLAALSCARALPTTTTPKKFASRHQRGKRSAERRMPSMSALRRQVCANLRHSSAPRLRALSGHARLSALTLAALATGYHPDGSALEPGFPKRTATGVLPAWPILFFGYARSVQTGLFAGRPGTQSRPGADWQFRARAPPLASVFQACPSGKAPSMSEVTSM